MDFTPDDLALVRRLADEAAIRDLAARFSDACGRAAFDDFGALWTDNGVWRIGDPYPRTETGRPALVAMLRDLMADWAHFVQLLHSGIIRIDGDRATARWVVRENAKSKDGTRYYDNLALYEDEIVRGSGGWRYVSRTYDYIWLSSAPLAGQSFPLPAGLSGFTDW